MLGWYWAGTDLIADKASSALLHVEGIAVTDEDEAVHLQLTRLLVE
ncbi:MAG: hypothetical protein M3518_04535 [Actinomycetota bacterium]|nr:hypothetical protein [Actinomycetota bacterium]